jgi:hypothetical protein
METDTKYVFPIFRIYVEKILDIFLVLFSLRWIIVRSYFKRKFSRNFRVLWNQNRPHPIFFFRKLPPTLNRGPN